MRVLHLATTYPLHARDSNAAFVQAIAEGLAARGHEIDVLLPWHPDLELRRPGTRVALRAFQYTPTRHWHPWGYAQALRGDRELRRDAYLAAVPAAVSSWAAIRAALRRGHWDLLHAHWLLPNAPIMAAARGHGGPPLVISCHGSGVFLAERSRWTGAAARWALRRAAAVTGCSGDLCRRLDALGGGPAAQRIPYGVDTESFRPLEAGERSATRSALAAAHGVPASGPWIVAVGRLVYKKGFDVLMRAMPRILAAAPEARCLVAGDGPLEGELKAAAAAEGVAERVHFLGAVAHAEIPRLYAAADVMAVPSVHGPGGNVDGLPNVLMESLASGAAIVASRVAGIPDVIRHDHNGLLFDEGDAAALAAAVVRTLTEPGLAIELGANARADTVAELRWERICERFETVYRGALK